MHESLPDDGVTPGTPFIVDREANGVTIQIRPNKLAGYEFWDGTAWVSDRMLKRFYPSREQAQKIMQSPSFKKATADLVKRFKLRETLDEILAKKTTVPHLATVKSQDELVEFYKKYGGRVNASDGGYGFQVRLPKQQRIHFYVASHAHAGFDFKSEGYYDSNSRYWDESLQEAEDAPDFKKLLALWQKVKALQKEHNTLLGDWHKAIGYKHGYGKPGVSSIPGAFDHPLHKKLEQNQKETRDLDQQFEAERERLVKQHPGLDLDLVSTAGMYTLDAYKAVLKKRATDYAWHKQLEPHKAENEKLAAEMRKLPTIQPEDMAVGDLVVSQSGRTNGKVYRITKITHGGKRVMAKEVEGWGEGYTPDPATIRLTPGSKSLYGQPGYKRITPSLLKKAQKLHKAAGQPPEYDEAAIELPVNRLEEFLRVANTVEGLQHDATNVTIEGTTATITLDRTSAIALQSVFDGDAAVRFMI